MKKLVLTLALGAFSLSVLSPVLISADALAYHDKKCKNKKYEWDDDKKKCVRKSRGSHG